MDLAYPPEAEEFRSEIAEWLKANLPEGWGGPGFTLTPEERKAFNEEWTAKLYGGGWICASWPTEYGGKGLSLLQQVVLNEEFARAGAPLRADFFGDTLVGPTILQWGTEEQKKQFIPGILQGEIAWCQGFSEPDAGSDLAEPEDAGRARRRRVGDQRSEGVDDPGAVRGLTSFFWPAPTPTAPKHAGISYLLVPMKQPGVEVRPIEQVDGSAEFNEVFFTNVRCPKDNVIGGVNNGWKVAMTTLGFERGTSSTTGHRRFQKEFDEILAEARRRGRASDPLTRQRLARSWSKIKIMQINGFRTLTDVLNGTHTTAALSACNKMFWSEAHQETLSARDGHPGHGRPDPPGRRRARTPSSRAPAGPKPTTPSTTCSHCSSSRARRRSGAGQPRFSGTSWASASSVSRRNRNLTRRARASAAPAASPTLWPVRGRVGHCERGEQPCW